SKGNQNEKRSTAPTPKPKPTQALPRPHAVFLPPLPTTHPTRRRRPPALSLRPLPHRRRPPPSPSSPSRRVKPLLAPETLARGAAMATELWIRRLEVRRWVRMRRPRGQKAVGSENWAAHPAARSTSNGEGPGSVLPFFRDQPRRPPSSQERRPRRPVALVFSRRCGGRATTSSRGGVPLLPRRDVPCSCPLPTRQRTRCGELQRRRVVWLDQGIAL
uniref:Uncharacterized protein n=1 Tax=Aegilops tauschii subsp. strangulata TaxID=200361 RepID=A0A453H6X6_AEGTS